jgi:hypothetical protein
MSSYMWMYPKGVGSSRQEQFRNSHRKLTATGMNVVRDLVRDRQEEEEDSGPRIDIIDSHFHLDLIIQRERLRGLPEGYQVGLIGSVLPHEQLHVDVSQR